MNDLGFQIRIKIDCQECQNLSLNFPPFFLFTFIFGKEKEK